MSNKTVNLYNKIIDKINWILFREAGLTELNPRVKTYIISYPKSGRTWLRVLLGKILCEQFALNERYLLNTIKLSVMADLPGINWDHDGAGLGGGPHFIRFVTDKSVFRDRKIVFLYRHPHDVMVSSYFHATKRIHNFTHYDGTIQEFIRSREYGIEKLINFYNIWYKNRYMPEDFLLIRYEELHDDTASTLRKLLDFLGIDNVTNETIDNAIKFASFRNMKNMEEEQSFNSKIMQPGKKDDNESYKVRKGKVGGYVDYLTSQDIAYIDKAIARLGCPFYEEVNH